MPCDIILSSAEIEWAITTAQTSLAKWATKAGYYNNRFRSHLKGRLGEVAVEKFVAAGGAVFIPHFRFPQRENLCDIQIQQAHQMLCRIEVKTWSAEYWPDLGRCIALDQYATLQRKADCVIWGIVEKLASHAPPYLRARKQLVITLAGWSTLAEIKLAPLRATGHQEMRKVHNYQLDETALRPIETFFPILLKLASTAPNPAPKQNKGAFI